MLKCPDKKTGIVTDGCGLECLGLTCCLLVGNQDKIHGKLPSGM